MWAQMACLLTSHSVLRALSTEPFRRECQSLREHTSQGGLSMCAELSWLPGTPMTASLHFDSVWLNKQNQCTGLGSEKIRHCPCFQYAGTIGEVKTLLTQGRMWFRVWQKVQWCGNMAKRDHYYGCGENQGSCMEEEGIWTGLWRLQ